MDIKTGKIELFETESDAEKRRRTPLSPKEYQAMMCFGEEQRPLELALMRFVEERKRLKAPNRPEVRNAFRLGWLAAEKTFKP